MDDLNVNEHHALAPSRERIAAVIRYVCDGLLERESQARCLVLAALAGEHVLFIGPPGTAKSELARRLHQVVGGRHFERLLTRFTVPEELFGPLSLAALDEGRYERDVDGYLPTATVAFLDEVFKANSAILNALLTLLNERVFDQGAARIPVPLVSVVAASNEAPDDEALRAFFDRFMFRCPVAPVSDEAFGQLLAVGEAVPGDGPRLSEQELAAARHGARSVELPGEMAAALKQLRAFLQARSIGVSDRRWVRIVHVLRVAAAADGRAQVGVSDLCVLPFLVSERAEQTVLVQDWYADLLGAGQEVTPQRLARVVEAFDKQIELESGATELAFDDSGKLEVMRSVGGTQDGAMSGAAPRMSAFSRRKRFSPTHIRARIVQIDAVLSRIDAFVDDSHRQRGLVCDALCASLWAPPALVARTAAVFDSNLARVLAQRVQLGQTRGAFAALPLADNDDGVAPAPVDVAA